MIVKLYISKFGNILNELIDCRLCYFICIFYLKKINGGEFCYIWGTGDCCLTGTKWQCWCFLSVSLFLWQTRKHQGLYQPGSVPLPSCRTPRHEGSYYYYFMEKEFSHAVKAKSYLNLVPCFATPLTSDFA